MTTDRLTTLTFENRNKLETMLMEFDESWTTSSLKKAAQLLATDAFEKDFRQLAVVELVKIDLQRRWSAGQGKLIEDYYQLLPTLELEVDAELIVVEFNERRRVEKDVNISEYQDRFPDCYSDVTQIVSENEFFDNDISATVGPGQANIETSRIAAANKTGDSAGFCTI
jgi:hypothetical protein